MSQENAYETEVEFKLSPKVTSKVHFHDSNPMSSSRMSFFTGADRKFFLDEVVHLCQFGNNLVAVVGEQGVGKTTLVTQALSELADTAFCCYISGEQGMAAEDIFSHIISQLELSVLPTSSVGEMVATLRRAMAEGNLNRVVIIIDDAHFLSDPILSTLTSLLQGQQENQHLHLLISGDNQLVSRLDQFEMTDVMIYDVPLTNLSFDEFDEYIRFKLSHLNLDEIEWNESQVKKLWQQTSGNLARIQQAMASLAFEKDLSKIEESKSGLPMLHLSMLVLLLAGLIMALMYVGSDDKPVSTEIDMPIPPELSSTSPTLPVVELDSPTQEKEILEGTQNISVVDEQVRSPESGQEPIEVNESQSSLTPQQVAPSKELTDESAQLDKKQDQKMNQELTQGINEALQQDINKELQQELVSLNKPAEIIESPAEAAPVEEEKQVFINTKQYTSDEKVVMAWPDNAYTLQVMAAGQEKNLRDFINAQPNRDQMRLVAMERSGKPWYVVLLGVYDDGGVASKAVQKLPQEQVNSGPWPRQISQIKREITAFRR